MSAPNRIPATFIGGTLGGKWTYLTLGMASYTSPTEERYRIVDTIWHSHQDDVMSHQVYELELPFGSRVTKGKR